MTQARASWGLQCYIARRYFAAVNHVSPVGVLITLCADAPHVEYGLAMLGKATHVMCYLKGYLQTRDRSPDRDKRSHLLDPHSL